MEALTHKPTTFPKMLRLNHIRQLARNLIHSIADHDSQIMIDQIVPDLIPDENLLSHGKLRDDEPYLQIHVISLYICVIKLQG